MTVMLAFPPHSKSAAWSWIFDAFKGDEAGFNLDAVKNRVMTLSLIPLPPAGSREPVVMGTDTDGTIVAAGSTFSLMLRAAALREMALGSYLVSLAITNGNDTAEYALGALPLTEGQES